MRVLVSSTSGYGHVLPMLAAGRCSAGARPRGPLGDRRERLPAGAGGRHRGGRGRSDRRGGRAVAGSRPTVRGRDTAPGHTDGRVPAAVRRSPRCADAGRTAARSRASGDPICSCTSTASSRRRSSPRCSVCRTPCTRSAGASPATILADGSRRSRTSGRSTACPCRRTPGASSTSTSTSARRPADRAAGPHPRRPGRSAGDLRRREVPDLDTLLPEDDGRPLVYVTLGTVNNQVPRPPAVAEAVWSSDVRLLVTVGRGVDPAALGPVPRGVRVQTLGAAGRRCCHGAPPWCHTAGPAHCWRPRRSGSRRWRSLRPPTSSATRRVWCAPAPGLALHPDGASPTARRRGGARCPRTGRAARGRSPGPRRDRRDAGTRRGGHPARAAQPRSRAAATSRLIAARSAAAVRRAAATSPSATGTTTSR